MNSILSTLLALWLAVIAPGAGSLSPVTHAAKPVSLPYEEIAKGYAQSLGLPAAEPESIQYEDVLSKHFVQARLGVFDLRFPMAEVDRRLEDFRGCAISVIDAQQKWLDWVQASGPEAQALREDLKALGGWLKSSKAPGAAALKGDGSQDVFKLLQAPDAIVEAGKRAATALGKASMLGPAREQPLCLRLVLLPSRKSFTEFVYFRGLIVPQERGVFWLDSVPDWTQCTVGSDMALALEYAPANREAADYTSGTRMNERGPNVMEQQVVQLAMLSMFDACYGGRAPGAFLGGLSINLVVEQFGLVNTRADGDTRSKTTGKREGFVAGGDAEGGFLPKNSAESRWREKHGADHFVSVLRAAQKSGEDLGKHAKNKVACFAVRADSGEEQQLVTAPFLGGSTASSPAPPKAFQGDFAEFIRAYKSAFIYWLQTKSKGTEKPSREKFAALLKKLADPNMQSDFEQVFKDVYDSTPLSAADAGKSSLEGQFLIWLSKQK